MNGRPHPQHLYFASDYFDKLYEFAVHLIKIGKAYVDAQTLEQMRATRGSVTQHGTDSPFRDRSVEENLRLFTEMKDGKHAEVEPAPGADVRGAGPVPVQMWQGRARSRRRCGTAGRVQSRSRCDETGERVPAQVWQVQT